MMTAYYEFSCHHRNTLCMSAINFPQTWLGHEAKYFNNELTPTIMLSARKDKLHFIFKHRLHHIIVGNVHILDELTSKYLKVNNFTAVL